MVSSLFQRWETYDFCNVSGFATACSEGVCDLSLQKVDLKVVVAIADVLEFQSIF